VPRNRTSHAQFSHDSIASLGYDWARIGGVDGPGRYPHALYLPETTADVAAVVQESILLGRPLRIRGKGHSSNDLVVSDRGALLCTERLCAIGRLDADDGTITVQSGVTVGELEEHLAQRGFGLPVAPDHPDITVGGYASAGGLGPASHRFGLFADTIAAAEYVDWSGRIARVSRDDDAGALRRLLGGVGRHGVITELTCDVIAIDKRRTVLRNDRRVTRDFGEFARMCTGFAAEPGDARYARGVWLDAGAGKPRIGQLSRYRAAPAGRGAGARNAVSYGALHRVGRLCSALPPGPAAAVKAAGSLAGMIASPRYASVRNIELFTDAIIDHTVGDPARTLVAVAPVETLEATFHDLYERCVELRSRERCLTFISLHFKGIRSAYLAGGSEPRRYGELMLILGIAPARMSEPLLDELVADVDRLCVEHEAFRLLHTKTGADPRVDPNSRYAGVAQPA
jgi:FAD binding domain